VPGFVFAPRPSAPLSDFNATPFPPEAELPDVLIPPLFPVHPSSPQEKAVPVSASSQKAEAAPAPSAPAEEVPHGAPLPDAHSQIAESAPLDEGERGSENADELPPASDLEESARPRDQERQISQTKRESAALAQDLLGTHFSLARIDQEPLQAIFMTEEFLDLPRVSQLSCGFPGITGCMIVAGDALAQGGERPAGLDAQALCQLTKQLSAVAAAFPEELPAVQTYTLHIGNRALSIFARPHVSLCLVHSHRGFLPGVRERLAAVADTLSRGLSGEAEAG
jgi:hypothetical protein